MSLKRSLTWVNFSRPSFFGKKIICQCCTFLQELTIHDHESDLQTENFKSSPVKFWNPPASDCFCQSLSICKNEHHSSIQSWDIANLRLRINFGMPMCAWPHPSEWTESNRFIFVYLTTCKKINFISKFILINLITKFILTCCFESLLTPLTTPSWKDWMNLLLLLIPYHMQKFNLIT